ncbi:MAG: SLC13 family permease [Deltaproteobacteria bacterium]|nr:SLC13 family permease [Deltaproteobacteria bacterium]
MGWDAWFTLGIVVLSITLLATTRVGPELILLGGLTLLMVSGILTPEQALAGASNAGMITVGVLFVVAAAVRNTGAMELLTARALGHPRSVAAAQLRMMAPVSLLSAVLNNTPVVALFIPTVVDWARKHNLPASKLMIPLSYASVLGGTVTLIGSSTNLIINGLWVSELGKPSLGMFEIARLGLPSAVIGVGFVVLTSRWLLPNRVAALHRMEDPREYTVEMLVSEGGPLIGQTIEGAGLRHLEGLYLLEILRGEGLRPAVEPTTRLEGGDRLVFVGIVASVVELQRKRGLQPATDQVFKLDSRRSERLLFEAVVSSTCSVVGRTIREGRFRTYYNAAVIAVARNGERLPGKIGDIRLRAGDTLLVEAHPSFAVRMTDSREFFLVSRIEDFEPPRHDRAWIALPVLVAMVTVAAMGWMSMLLAAIVAAAALMLTGAIDGAQARRAIDWQVLLVIVAAFGMGRALQITGAAEIMANSLIGAVGEHPLAVLAVLYGVTSLFTELITNNGAAVLVFPIAVAAAQRMGVDPLPFVMAIMMAASASFATPIGYQTNMMVYGPGGYRFTDFLRIGVPMNLVMWGVTVALAPWIWPFTATR